MANINPSLTVVLKLRQAPELTYVLGEHRFTFHMSRTGKVEITVFEELNKHGFSKTLLSPLTFNIAGPIETNGSIVSLTADLHARGYEAQLPFELVLVQMGRHLLPTCTQSASRRCNQLDGLNTAFGINHSNCHYLSYTILLPSGLIKTNLQLTDL